MRDEIGVFIIAFHPDSFYKLEESQNNMSFDDLLILTEILIQNNLDICINNQLQKVFILCDNALKDIHIKADSHQLVFTAVEDLSNFISEQAAKYSKLLIINGNMIGMTGQKIDFILNMLDMEEEVCVFGTDVNDRLNFTANCRFDKKILEYQLGTVEYQKIFQASPEIDFYYLLVNNVYSIGNLTDFKKLYATLSQRENFNFCSKEIYDRFTELFIEYKELIA